ncbi:MAG: alpha-hydroxy acid oxidase [Pseudomonadota bacterium]|nr:alpha-hydroxy acid oxidase [Pseudomonadota bacterium]
MKGVASIADLRQLARRRIPRALFDYADGGSYDEITLRRNRADLDAIQLRPRVLVDLGSISVTTTVLGEDWSIPIAIAPTGLAGLFYGNGEIHGARAAEAFGIPFCLSTMSICSIEDVRAAVKKPFWFQVYLMRDHGFNAELIERARGAGCSALVLTVDVPVLAHRRRDTRNGLTIPPRLTFRTAMDLATKPAWALSMLMAGRWTFGNLGTRLRSASKLTTLAQWTAAQFDPTVSWKDAEWIRRRWPGKIVLKGILDPDDARRACEAGMDAIIVSNHGGRQLDGACSTISALPEVVDAVQGRCEVLFDGGIQSGQDVLKALALGARGCLIGKGFLYSLAARGETGVTLALQILREELLSSLGLMGCPNIRAVTPRVLRSVEPADPITGQPHAIR